MQYKCIFRQVENIQTVLLATVVANPSVQMEDTPQRVLCTLCIQTPLLANILKVHIAVLGPLTEPGATHKTMIYSTSKEVGMALVVMGKRIAQQHVPNL
jgi:predicted permease